MKSDTSLQDSRLAGPGWDAVQRRRFGHLTASVWCDPALALRYEREPRAVLVDFGLDLPAGGAAPAIAPRPGDLSVEALSGSEDAVALPCMCFCGFGVVMPASEGDPA